jgi:cell division septation protein DedD
MSVVGSGEDEPCTRSANPVNWDSPLHEAVCKVYDAGIPIVAAAGNNNKSAANVTPATFDEVVAVSAFADFNGAPGGGAPRPAGCSSTTQDDRFYANSANVGSNWGPDIDIMAPGVCIVSTAMGGGTERRSGTSMAAPHVTGALALYLSQNSSASVDSAKAWLYGNAVAQSDPAGILGGDPDGIVEPVLRVGLGDVPTATPTVTAMPSGTVVVPKNAYKLIYSDRSVNSAASKYVRDNKLSTVWATKSAKYPPASAFVWVELQDAAPIGSIRWIFGEYGIADRYWIETSNDLVNWTRIAKRTNKPVGQWQEAPVNNITAKYVRFRFDNYKNDPRVGGIAEIQVWAPGAPPVNPTPTAAPPVKYEIATTYQTINSQNGIRVKDGDAGTYWRTKTSSTVPSSASVQVSLGSQKHVGVVRWMFGLEGAADVVKIDISWDQTNWTNIATRTNAPLYEWQELVVNLDARFIRWTVQNPNGDNPIGGIAEIEVWSGPGGPLSNVVTPSGVVDGSPQETATPTPTATETGGGVDITETPESTETPVPTETPTQAPTETPTETATTELTMAPTETPIPTESSTETPAPTETVAPTGTPTIEVVNGDDVESPEPEPLRARKVRDSRNADGGRNLVDGDLSTVCITKPSETIPETAFVTLNLNRTFWIGSVRWYIADHALADAYVVEVSDDNENWTLIYQGGGGEPGQWAEAPVGVEGQYVRFTFTNPNGDAQIGSLAEVEIWP